VCIPKVAPFTPFYGPFPIQIPMLLLSTQADTQTLFLSFSSGTLSSTSISLHPTHVINTKKGNILLYSSFSSAKRMRSFQRRFPTRVS
jgi:hypothetical protein